MKLTTEQQQACKAALEITDSYERIEYMEQHGILGAPMWYYKCNYQRATMTRTAKSKARVRVLASQSNRCALCDTDIKPGVRCCLDKTGKVVCMTCNQLLSLLRRYKVNGLTATDFNTFDREIE